MKYVKTAKKLLKTLKSVGKNENHSDVCAVLSEIGRITLNELNRLAPIAESEANRKLGTTITKIVLGPRPVEKRDVIEKAFGPKKVARKKRRRSHYFSKKMLPKLKTMRPDEVLFLTDPSDRFTASQLQQRISSWASQHWGKGGTYSTAIRRDFSTGRFGVEVYRK